MLLEQSGLVQFLAMRVLDVGRITTLTWERYKKRFGNTTKPTTSIPEPPKIVALAAPETKTVRSETAIPAAFAFGLLERAETWPKAVTSTHFFVLQESGLNCILFLSNFHDDLQSR